MNTCPQQKRRTISDAPLGSWAHVTQGLVVICVMKRLQGEFESGCGCQDNCYEQFSVEEIIDIRLNMKELDKR